MCLIVEYQNDQFVVEEYLYFAYVIEGRITKWMSDMVALSPLEEYKVIYLAAIKNPTPVLYLAKLNKNSTIEEVLKVKKIRCFRIF